MKMIVTLIPANLVTNLLLSLFCLLRGWWSGKEKYFCFFLFIASRALLERNPEFNRLLQ